jgi:hypothetical protein
MGTRPTVGPLFIGGRSPVDIIAAFGFLCLTVVCVIAQGVYQRRKAAGLHEDLTPLPWKKQIW